MHLPIHIKSNLSNQKNFAVRTNFEAGDEHQGPKDRGDKYCNAVFDATCSYEGHGAGSVI